MKKSINFIVLLVSILVIHITLNSCTKDDNLDPTDHGPGTNANWENTCDCLNNLYPTETLSIDERDALLFMREEEKLARDVYEYLYQKWEHHVFNNITSSENQHISIVLCLMDKYDINDIAADRKRGEFVNEELQTVYNSLIDQGNKSLVDAFTVGATIEDVDIRDLEAYDYEVLNNKDIQAAFDELTKGSRNHMRAFIKNLGNLGATYEAQFIEQEALEDIINSGKETNEIICNGS